MRKLRQYSEIGRYHCIIRGVDKQNIFYEDSDKLFFIHKLKLFSEKYQILVYAYCLMDNHVHILIHDSEKKLSSFIQTLASTYARYFNRKYDRIGHLYQDRFLSETIDDDSYLLTAFRYILRNPENAFICKTSEYKWSSYKSYKTKKSFIDYKTILSFFKSSGELYSFINKKTEDKCIETELRPSEKWKWIYETITSILQLKSPHLAHTLEKKLLDEKIRKLKETGISINAIARITHLNRIYIKRC